MKTQQIYKNYTSINYIFCKKKKELNKKLISNKLNLGAGTSTANRLAMGGTETVVLYTNDQLIYILTFH